MNLRICLLAAVLCCSFVGCTPRYMGEPVTDFSYFTDERAHQPGLIVVLPVYRAEGVGRSASAFDQSLASALREQRAHEIITISVAQRDQIFPTKPVALHNIQPDDLRELRDLTGADGVVITFIDQYQSFDPIHCGLRSYLVSCHDGATIWTASGHFDSGRRDVQKDIDDWYRRGRGKANSNLSGWRSAMTSPSVFSRYVSDRIAASVLW